MHNMRKFVAVLLSVVMVFAMNVGAFAATNATATIQVYNGTTTYIPDSSTTFTITSGMTAKDALDLYAATLAVMTWKEVQNYNPGFTGSGYVVEKIKGISGAPVGSASGISAEFWSTTFPGYGIESITGTGDDKVYNFIYVGDDWEFTVNGEVPEDPDNTMADGTPYQLYMNQYTVQSDDEIAVSYERQILRWSDSFNFLEGE